MTPKIPVFLGIVAVGAAAHAQEKVTYADHARAAMENKCFSCHNPDKKKGDLDLTTYAGTMAGGGGGAVVDPGNPDASKLILTVLKKEEPFMPPEGPPMSPAEIEVLKKWIAGGVLETGTSVAKKSNKPKIDLNVAAGAGKPEGPIAKPEHVLLEPVVVTPRTTAVVAMAASPWTSLVAFAAPHQILLYDTDTRQLAGVFPYTEGYARSLKFSASGSLLVMGGGKGGKNGHAIVWDVKSGKRVAEVGKESDSVMSADISPDHSKVVIGSPSKKVKCYDLATGEELYTIGKHTEWILSTDFSPDGILLATSDRNGNVFVWEAENGGEFFLLGQHRGGACTDVAWRADSNVLASCSRDGSVILWEMNEGKQLKTWNAHSGGVESVSFTPDGKVVTCGMDGKVATWDINGNKLSESPSLGDIATDVVALHDSKAVVAANWRGEVKILSIDKGMPEIGALSSNPPQIAQRIVQAEQRLGELNGKVAPSQVAVTKAEAELKAKNDALAKGRADLDGAESRSKALPGEIKTAEDQLAKDTASRAQLGKDREARLAAIKAFADKKAKLAELEKQLAPLAVDLPKLAAADKALADVKAVLEAAKKELAAKAGDAALTAKVKDAEAKVAATTAEQQKLAPIKLKADPISAQIQQAKQQLGAEPAPVADLDKAIAEADAKIKAAPAAIAAKKAELTKLAEAVKNRPAVMKNLEGAVSAAQAALAKAQSDAKAVQSELAITQKLIPSLKAAQFNVGLLKEKEVLAKLESDIEAYTAGQKDNEDAKVAAAQRIEASKKAIAEAQAAQAALDAAFQQQLTELQPVEKVYTDSKAKETGLTAQLTEQKQMLAAKEAVLAALAKTRDDAIAAAKKAAEEIQKQIAVHQKAYNESNTKLAAPAKNVETKKIAKAAADTQLAEAKKKQGEATADQDSKTKDLATKDAALTKAKADHEAAKKTLAEKKQIVDKAQKDLPATKATLAATEKAAAAAKVMSQPEAAELGKKVEELKATVAALEKSITDVNADIAARTQALPGIAAAQEAANKARVAAAQAENAAKSAATTAVAQVKAKDAAVAQAAAQVQAAEKAAAPLIAAFAAAKAKLEGAQKSLAEKQAVPAAAQKDFAAKSQPVNAEIAQVKATIAAQEKLVADATAKAGADQKLLEAKRGEVGKAQAAAEGNKKKKADAEAAIAAATKEIPDREKNVAEAKAELAKLTPQLEPLKQKVKQLSDQYFALLPKP